MPLHLNFHLYGWMSVPLLGILFYAYLRPDTKGLWTGELLLYAWSASLLFGGVTWLLGSSSGKLFLDWEGPAARFFLIMLCFFWVSLLVEFLLKLCGDEIERLKPRSITSLKLLFLLALGCVPVSFSIALNPQTFPPINYMSSGATGASLLVSTLGVIALFVLIPLFLPLKVIKATRSPQIILLLVFHFMLWSIINHSNSSHHDPEQIFALLSLLIWLPVLSWYYSCFAWPKGCIVWLKSFCAWGALLLFSALVTFLPGVLELAKFTNILVAHVHIAMAGMASSFLFVVLSVLLQDARSKLELSVSAKTPFSLWQLGLIIQIIALFWLGVEEARMPVFLFQSSLSRTMAYMLRSIGGALMLAASFCWLCLLIYQSRQGSTHT